MYRFAKNLKKQPYPNYYPTDLNFEMTTYCNSNCLFCTREKLISNNQRPLKHMSMETFHKTLNLFKRLTDEIPPTMLKINPTGLGEPTLHPQLWCALHQVRDEFPYSRIMMNTNGVGLNEAQALLTSCASASDMQIKNHTWKTLVLISTTWWLKTSKSSSKCEITTWSSIYRYSIHKTSVNSIRFGLRC
jgi:sulfatase maturation enzyme AslB (radical SAM superfamily)